MVRDAAAICRRPTTTVIQRIFLPSNYLVYYYYFLHRFVLLTRPLVIFTFFKQTAASQDFLWPKARNQAVAFSDTSSFKNWNSVSVWLRLIFLDISAVRKKSLLLKVLILHF
jgi:hypothetical protein